MRLGLLLIGVGLWAQTPLPSPVINNGGGSGGGTGTVTSVSGPSWLTWANSTTTPTATVASQTANTFLASPNGTAGSATFRGVVAADIPTLNQNTTGNAGTATALAATPTLCSTGSAPTGVLASGNATGCATVPQGTVTAVSITTANGFSGTVATPTTTPAITLMATGPQVTPKTTAYTILSTDKGNIISLNASLPVTVPVCGSTGFSQGFTVGLSNNVYYTELTATTSTSNFYYGGITGTTLTLIPGSITWLTCDGTNWLVSASPTIAAGPTWTVFDDLQIATDATNVIFLMDPNNVRVGMAKNTVWYGTNGSNVYATPVAQFTQCADTTSWCAGTSPGGLQTVNDSTGTWEAAQFISAGTKFTTSGCSISSTTGGGSAGKFTLGANNCTVVVTINGTTGKTSPNGWSCWVNDQTAPTIFIANTTSSATTASFAIPVTAGATDVINFGCLGY